MAPDDFSAILRWTKVACRWSRKVCIECCSRKERNEMGLLKAGVCKLRGIGGGMDNGSKPLCLVNEDAERLLLICLETIIWGTEFLYKM
jgi:hypothetical protein